MRIVAALLITGLCLPAQSLSGRRAPSFSLPDAGLAQHDILDYRGQWLLIDFMKTDCAACKDLSKKLEALKAKYPKKLAVLSVVVYPENQQTVNKYVGETKVTSPILFDSGQVTMSYFKSTPQNAAFDTPHLFAINPTGMIVKDWNQFQSVAPGLDAEIEQLLSVTANTKK